MKLLFYSPRFYPLLGGLERVVEAWGNELAKKGVIVDLITTTRCKEPDQFDFRVHRGPSFSKTVRLMRQADVVVQFNVSLKGIPAWIMSGKPLVITHHTLLVEPGTRGAWQQRLKLIVSNSFARVNICCSRYIADQFNHALVVHSPYQEKLFKNLQLPRQSRSLIFAGRLVTDKGVNTLLQALALIDKNKYDLLTIVGDGPEKPALESLATQLGISDKVVFRGRTNAKDLVTLLNHAEIMIVPSVVEPFGITVLEGLACGCRMIVSNTGGVPEAAGGFARLFKKNDPECLATAILESLDEPRMENSDQVKSHLAGMTIPYTARMFYEAIAND